MKKIAIHITLFSCILFALSVNQLFAQYAYFGLKGGINISYFRGSDADPETFWGTGSEQNPRVGFIGGVYVTIVITRIIALQPELLISMMGTKYNWASDGEYDHLTLKLTYAQIPLLLKIYIPAGQHVKPHLSVGGYFALNGSAKFSREYNLPSYGLGQGTMEGDIEGIIPMGGSYIQYVSKPEYGILVGLGSDFIIRGYQFTFDARYSLGLREIFELESDVVPDIKNGAFSIMIGFGF